MNGMRDQFFTCSTFAADKHRRIRGVCFTDELINVPAPRALAHHVVFQSEIRAQPAVFRFEPFKAPRVVECTACHPCDADEQFEMAFIKMVVYRFEINDSDKFVEGQQWCDE